jgi:hypothetical protein
LVINKLGKSLLIVILPVETVEPESGSNLPVTLAKIIAGIAVLLLLGLLLRSRKRRITSTD